MELTDNSSLNPEDKKLFSYLRQSVQREISEYVDEPATDSVGTSWSAERIAQELCEMQRHLIDPHWVEVEIAQNAEESVREDRNIRRCVLLAEDGDYVLIFDPTDELYHLGCRRERGITTWGINGGAVDCFLAR